MDRSEMTKQFTAEVLFAEYNTLERELLETKKVAEDLGAATEACYTRMQADPSLITQLECAVCIREIAIKTAENQSRVNSIQERFRALQSVQHTILD